MIVNKPQFDVDGIKVGSAYRLVRRSNRAYDYMSVDCLILRVSPLSMDIVYFDDKVKDTQKLNIGIDEVVKGVFSFEPMKLKSVN